MRVRGDELFYACMVDNQAIVIPEAIDAIRALTGSLLDSRESIAGTDAAARHLEQVVLTGESWRRPGLLRWQRQAGSAPREPVNLGRGGGRPSALREGPLTHGHWQEDIEHVPGPVLCEHFNPVHAWFKQFLHLRVQRYLPS